MLEVNVYGVPERTTEARVGKQRRYLPSLNRLGSRWLDAALSRLRRSSKKRLADGGFLHDPHATLFVDEYASQRVSLLREAAKPGQYREQRLWDVISAAGGLTEKAGRSITITHKSRPELPKR